MTYNEANRDTLDMHPQVQQGMQHQFVMLRDILASNDLICTAASIGMPLRIVEKDSTRCYPSTPKPSQISYNSCKRYQARIRILLELLILPLKLGRRSDFGLSNQAQASAENKFKSATTAEGGDESSWKLKLWKK